MLPTANSSASPSDAAAYLHSVHAVRRPRPVRAVRRKGQTGRLAALRAGRQPSPERDSARRAGRAPAKNFSAMRKNFAPTSTQIKNEGQFISLANLQEPHIWQRSQVIGLTMSA